MPLAAHPYDPARVLRTLVPRRRRPGDARPPVRETVSTAAPGGGGARGMLKRLARRALYTEPALRLLGHMLLVVARRP